MSDDKNNINQAKRPVPQLDLLRMANALWHIKWWIVGFVTAGMVYAYFYIRYTTPQYRKSINIVMASRQNQFSDIQQLVANTLGGGQSTVIDDRLFLLRSSNLMRRVVERLDLEVRYFSVGRFTEIEQYTSSTMIFDFAPAEGFENTKLDMMVTTMDGGAVKIESLTVDNEAMALTTPVMGAGEVVETRVGRFCFSPRDSRKWGIGEKWHITRSGMNAAAVTMASRLGVKLASSQTNVITVSIEELHPRRAEEVLGTLMEEYNVVAKDYDSQGIINTIAFLDERIEQLDGDLQEVEKNYTSFRSANDLLDVESQSQRIIDDESIMRARLDEMAMQSKMLTLVAGSLGDNGEYQLITSNNGVSDAGFNSLVAHYNANVMEREKILSASSGSNPRVKELNATLNIMKANILRSIGNIRNTFAIQRRTIEKRLEEDKLELAEMPIKKLGLTRLSRDQQVKEPLYLLLQQKREEALLMLSSLSNSAFVVDRAGGSDTPVAPNQRNIYLMAFVLSLLLPVGAVVAINVLRNKVLFEKDIVDGCDIPVLGIVPRGERDSSLPMGAEGVRAAGHDRLNESFRMLRTKFHYLAATATKGGRAIQVTSSGAREGKSYIAVNMAMALALPGKRVVLVDADLRKPDVGRYLGLADTRRGLSEWLSGAVDDVHDSIVACDGDARIDVITAGDVPFNPGELLASDRFDKMLDTLRGEYDYVVIDSAPFFEVGDSFAISRRVDSVLWVVRSGFTRLRVLETLQNVFAEGFFPSIMMVLNAVDFRHNMIFGGGKRGIGYGYGYGFGNSYGAGYGYGVRNTK